MNELEALRHRAARERAGRIAAEELLQTKSGELYQSNEELKRLAKQLAADVDVRTRELLNAQQVAKLGTFVWDPINEKITWSEGVYSLLGLDPEHDELSFEIYLSMMHDDDRPMLEQKVAEVVAGEPSAANEYEVLHRSIRGDGRTIWLKGHARAVPNRRGRVDRVICTVQDVTAQIEQEEVLALNRSLLESRIEELEATQQELERTRDEARSANQAKSRFIAMISHEIRTPLNGILGTLRLLRDRVVGAEKQQLVRTAYESADQLRVIVNDVIDFAALETGRVKLEPVVFDVREWLSEACDVWRASAAAAGDELQRSVDARVPAYLVGDASRVRQVLNNLISNAIKFTHNGTIQVRLELDGTASPSATKAHILLSVADSGDGISRQDQAKLFKEFSQIDSRAGRGGSGLGLAICRALVMEMDGHIGVVSAPGLGSTFSVRLSLPVAEKGVHTEEPVVCGILRTLTGDAPRILLAEDVQANQLVARMMLEDWGCAVEIAENGIEAVNACRERPFDLVLMDVSMPEMDGLQATESIRSLPGPVAHGLPIIGVTAFAQEGEAEKCMSAGMNAVLSKPIEWTRMYECLESYLASSSPEATDGGAPPGESCLDTDSLDRLTRGFSDSQVVAVLEQALNDIDEHRARAVSSAESGDAAQLAKSCHAIKGLAATFGSSGLAQTAATIEQQARAGDREAAIAGTLSSLSSQADVALGALQDYLSSRSGQHG